VTYPYLSRRAHRLVVGLATMLACSGDGASTRDDPTAPLAVVTVDSTTRFQTMSGWEAVTQIGQEEPGFAAFQKSALFDDAVANLGIDRVRLEVRAGAENSVDYYARRRAGENFDWRAVRYATVNDNADPNVINPAGFQFTEMDEAVEQVVLPMRQRLAARGERLYVNLCYVAFVQSSAGYVHENPDEYAELMVAVFQHLRDRYQLVPDAVEMILEPDNSSMWRGPLIGRAMVATAARLDRAGFRPEFVAPSNTSMGASISYFDEMIAVPGVAGLVDELAYHRYRDVSDDNLRAIAQRGRQYGIRTAMLEHIESDVEDLYKDLTLANASSWEQFVLAYPVADNGAQYYTWQNNAPVLSARAKYLRQYFRYVRQGAVRVAAASSSSAVRPVAFRNANGRFAVVMHVARGGEITVRGVPAGTYGASSTSDEQAAQELGTFTATPGGELRFSAPFAGVVTLYRR
jgi:hypothetical protein